MSFETETPSRFFRLRTRNCDGVPYEEREVNMAFEQEYLPLFEIVPPTAGSFIYLEAKYRVDGVAYHKGKIVLCLTLDF